jgi:hypothetical protein
MKAMDSIVQRFNAIRWHDSKLRGLAFYRADSEERVRLSLEIIREGGVLSPTEMVFKECAYVEATVYLEAKYMCADDIWDAECSASSDWKKAVSEPSLGDVIRGGRQFERYLHFRITMCPPGGTINILARDFAVESAVST